MLSPIKIAARDRRGAANHEAGHFVVATWAGMRNIGAWIGPRRTNDPLHDATWTGQMMRPDWDALSPHRRRMVAMAGGMAEFLWRAESWELECFCAEDWLSEPEVMSPSDWFHAGGNIVLVHLTCEDQGWQRSATQVLKLLSGPLRESWLRAARTLIDTGVLFAPKASSELRQAVLDAREVAEVIDRYVTQHERAPAP